MKDETNKLLEKALHAIRATEVLLKSGEYDAAASRAYYTMFYIAKALLCEKGLKRFTKHRAVHAAFGEHFAKTSILDPKFHRRLLEAFDARIQGDYTIDSVMTSEDVTAMLQSAREFLEAARQYLVKFDSA